MFIGINPSFKDGDPVLGSSEYNGTYKLNIPEEEIHPHLRKCKEIATSDGIDLPFGHHDLFPIRESKQSVIESMFDISVALNSLSKNSLLGFIHDERWNEDFGVDFTHNHQVPVALECGYCRKAEKVPKGENRPDPRLRPGRD